MITSHLRGDTAKAHQENVAKLHDYLIAIRADGSGLPAEPSKPFAISFRMVAKEAGVHLWVLNRPKLRCRKLIEDAARDIAINVRRKPRVRSIYTIGEAIAIAVATIQANCQAARVDHRPKCRRAAGLMKNIARRRPKGKLDDSITAISDALKRQTYSNADMALLVEIKDILDRATRGELELHTFHGRLKLESALVGFSLSALSKFTKADCQTVINWGAGIKAPSASFVGEIPKLERALGLEPGYLSDVYVSNGSGPSSIKRRFLPKEVLDMSVDKQTAFRRLLDPKLDLATLSDEQREKLMAETLTIFHRQRDTVDHKRAKLRVGDMQYGLRDLPDQLRREFDDLVAVRARVEVRDGVLSELRGWDAETQSIYHRRFCLFFGWLHHHMRVPLENLSIAYLAFSQILHEYELFLLARKESVKMERKWALAMAEWYVFAASLTRRPLGDTIDLDDDFDDFEGEAAGWLRGQQLLVKKLAPIDVPRTRDTKRQNAGQRKDIRPLLSAADISRAEREWVQLLDATTRRYRALREPITKMKTSTADSVARVIPIFRFENPLDAIEEGALKLRAKAEQQRPGSFHWCTAVRAAVALKLHAQLPLRRRTFCGLTYRPDNNGMIFLERGKWWARIPAGLFKNEKSAAFNDFVIDGFYIASLQDEWDFYTDLRVYLDHARDTILAGAKSEAFYVTRRNEGHVTPGTFAGQWRAMTRDYIAENPGRKTGLQGVKPFGSQAMRHIVASAVFYRTESLVAAAIAIHDSEKTTERHYKKSFVVPEKRAKIIRNLFGQERKGWRPFKLSLPNVPGPSVAPELRSAPRPVENAAPV